MWSLCWEPLAEVKGAFWSRVLLPPKSDRKSLIFPWHTQPPILTHTPSQSDGWRGENTHSDTATHTIRHTNTLLKPCALPPTLGQWPPPLSPICPWLSLSLPLSHLCLCGAAAAQRTEGAAFTSEHISHQMSPFAASPSNIQADNAPCILNIWLTTSPTKGAGWRSGLPTAPAGAAQSHVYSDTYSSHAHLKRGGVKCQRPAVIETLKTHKGESTLFQEKVLHLRKSKVCSVIYVKMEVLIEVPVLFWKSPKLEIQCFSCHTGENSYLHENYIQYEVIHLERGIQILYLTKSFHFFTRLNNENEHFLNKRHEGGFSLFPISCRITFPSSISSNPIPFQNSKYIVSYKGWNSRFSTGTNTLWTGAFKVLICTVTIHN